MKIKFPIWLIVGGLGILFLITGFTFDQQCPGGCIEQSVRAGIKSSGGAINIRIGDLHLKTGKDIDIAIDTDDSDHGGGESGPVDVALPDFAKIREVKIESVRTDWNIERGASGTVPSLTLNGSIRKNSWAIAANGDVLLITLKRKGPKSARLILPEGFQGDVNVSTVSGQLDMQANLVMENLKISSVSGDVALGAWPRQKLEISSVSGDVQNPAAAPGFSKNIVLSSISGDYSLTLSQAFVSLSADSVSGSLNLTVPKDFEFSYSLQSVSGEFQGLPESGATRIQSPGQIKWDGKVGKKPEATLLFNSVSGNLTIQGAQLGASLSCLMLASIA